MTSEMLCSGGGRGHYLHAHHETKDRLSSLRSRGRRVLCSSGLPTVIVILPNWVTQTVH